MLLIGHDMALLAQVTDRLGIMYAGRLVELGETDMLFRNPRHPYTQHLIASIPDLRDRRPLQEDAGDGARQWPMDAPLAEVTPGHFVRPWGGEALQ